MPIIYNYELEIVWRCKTYRRVISTVLTLIKFILINALTFLITLTFSRTISANPTKITKTMIWINTCTINTSLATYWCASTISKIFQESYHQ